MTTSSDYDAAMQIIKDLQARGLSPAEEVQVFEAMSVEVQSSSEDFMDGVKRLAEQAVKTERVFEDIRVQLAYVDQNDYKDKNGVPIAKFQPKWTTYQKRYTDLLWSSREAATITESYLRDFVNVVLPLVLEPDSTYGDNLKDLLAFAERTNPVKGEEKDDEFKKLQEDVEVFALSFSHFAEDEGARLSAEIKELNQKVDTLKKDLKELNYLVEQMCIAIGLTTAAGAIGIGAIAFFGLSTSFIISILTAGMLAIIKETSEIINTLRRKADVEIEIVEKQRGIDDLSKQQQRLEELRAKLELCTDQSSDMFGHLSSFSDMWSMCASNAHNLTGIIADVHTSKNVRARIELLITTYSSAADALELYARFLDTADVLQSYLVKKGEL